MTQVPGTTVVRYARPEPPMIGLTGLVRRVSDLGLGAASLVVHAAVDALDRNVATDESWPGGGGPGVLRHLPGAVAGVGLVAQRHLLDATEATERGLAAATRVAAHAPVVGWPLRRAEAYLESWAGRGESEQARNRALVTEFVRRLAPELATAVVAQLDVDRLVAQLPVDAIVAEVDIDALLERVDVDRIVQRVDVAALLERVDVNAIVERVDVAAIVDRVDIGPLVEKVLERVDIAAIVRESTGSITGDVVDGGRVTAMRVDGFIGRVSDRLLLRRRSRDVTVEGYEPFDEPEVPAP